MTARKQALWVKFSLHFREDGVNKEADLVGGRGRLFCCSEHFVRYVILLCLLAAEGKTSHTEEHKQTRGRLWDGRGRNWGIGNDVAL